MTSRTIRRILVVLVLLHIQTSRGAPQQIKPGCRYESRRYEEGAAVSTSEPCLQCRCIDGALRCRLRVCPRLPNPPPLGCRVRSPAENVCCAELICGESRITENMLRRSNVAMDEDDDASLNSHSAGCLHEGVRYGPGSAMMGSRRCEYCYCISGARRCIRPKCLLPLPGCTPLYAPHSCCPVAYNCTHLRSSTLSPISGNGCRVGDRVYKEGEMVREIEWKGSCDNCFCAMGAVRCVPLACAPPLQGCSPIVREGQCCPSTYNCSGSIEVKATQNYASYAFISKDYAKFRKETNFFPAIDQTTNTPVEGRGHRVVEERIDTSTIDIQDDSSFPTDSTSWPSTFETDIMDNEILVETVDYTKSNLEIATTTPLPPDELTTSTESTTTVEGTSSRRTEETVDDSPTTSSAITVVESTITATEDSSSSTDISTTTESITLIPEFNGNDVTVGVRVKEEERINIIEGAKNSTHTEPNETKVEDKQINTTMNSTKTRETMGSSGSSPAILMRDDVLVMNVTVKTNVSVGHIHGVTINPIRSIPPDVEAILNITHREKGEDYDYDYSEPTLPPSLPNVRIIPFVAADALVKEKTVSSAVTAYPSESVVVPPELRPTGTSGFYDMATQENRFSPPVETEGGFVPREPPYFEDPYRSTDLNLEIGTGVTVVPAPITNPHRKSDGNCLFENVEHQHGEILPSASICVICVCYYGKVICSTEKCPPLRIGCRRINTKEECCGKVVCVEADESPTVVLDRADATAPSQHQPMVSPDPFRDVIKTEPAPDLPSLIEDMIPYLVEHGITTSTTTLKTIQTQVSNNQPHPPEFDYAEKLPLIRPPFDYKETIDKINSKRKDGLQQDIKKNGASDQTQKTRDHVSQSPSEISGFDYDQVTLIKTENTTIKQEDPVSNTTDLGLPKPNRMKDDLESPLGPGIQDSTTEANGPSFATTRTPEIPEDDSIFSLDSVLDLLFSENNSKISDSMRIIETTSLKSVSSEDQKDNSLVPTTMKGSQVEVIETSSTIMDNEIPMSVGSLLKLAGCNIYGRMYRVGRIITELSGPCLECRCTEIGVQCKPLQC